MHLMGGTLGALIEWLEEMDQDRTLTYGFSTPHSYRGFYEDLAFTPRLNVKVHTMLKHAKEAVGKTFTGWKGGEYLMTKKTECWVAKDGELGVPVCKGMHEMWKAEIES